MNDKEKEKSLISKLKNRNNGDTLDFKIPEYLERKNIAYSGMLLDIRICRDALLELKKQNKEVVQTSLFTTIIVLYGKCFTDSFTSKYPKLEPKIFKSRKSKFQDLHEELMHMRHNYIAHRGLSQNEFGKAYFQINLRTMEYGITVGWERRHSFEAAKISEYLKLMDFLLVKVREKYHKVGQKITKHLFENSLKSGNGFHLEMVNSPEKTWEEYIMNYNWAK